MNHYQRFAGSLFKDNRLSRLPVSRSEFLGFSIRNDWVKIVKATVHAMNLEFHPKFCDSVALKNFVLLIIEVNACKHFTFVGAVDGERVVSIMQLRTKIPVIGVMHPN